MTYAEHLIRYPGEQNAIPPWLKQATAQRHAPPPDEIDILERRFPCIPTTTTEDTKSHGQQSLVDPQKYCTLQADDSDSCWCFGRVCMGMEDWAYHRQVRKYSVQDRSCSQMAKGNSFEC